MGDTLRSILTRLVAYVVVVIAAGLLFLAGATVYEWMWPRPVPLSQMSNSP
jgi:predicted membrane channel-forming protein YqfA (hemolysin III family)